MAGDWCTPPDSPSAVHATVATSYENAMKDTDWFYDWGHNLRVDDDKYDAHTYTVRGPENYGKASTSLPADFHRTPPEDTSSRARNYTANPQHPPAHITSSGNSGQLAGNVEALKEFNVLDGPRSVVVADNAPTTVGFDTVKVVVSPPSSGRSKSIEEADSKLIKYAPTEIDKHTPPNEDEKVAVMPFCFNYLSPFGADLDDTTDVPGGVLHKEEALLDDVLEGTSSSHSSSGIGTNPYLEFTQSYTCYDMMPTSIKMVVLDRRLPVKKAFFALVQNSVRAAPVWNSVDQEFVGMLTITDFINILICYYKSPIVEMDELEQQTIQKWRESEREIADLKTTLIQIDPMKSLYEAVKMLVEYRIHRLPVIDRRTGDAVYIMTHKRLLHYICLHVLDDAQPAFMGKSLQELGIGTHKNIATATQDTPLITALKIFAERRVSALPIVDEAGRVVDIYAKYDVINLAAERTYNNLDIPLHKALQHRAEGFEGVKTCLLSETLFEIVSRIVYTQVHRLVVVDEEKHVIGVISLSDLLSFLILQPPMQTMLSNM